MNIRSVVPFNPENECWDPKLCDVNLEELQRSQGSYPVSSMRWQRWKAVRKPPKYYLISLLVGEGLRGWSPLVPASE